MVTARTKLWIYKSKPKYRDVYVAENGLVFLGSADEPVDSIKEINAKYIYRNAEGKKAGNHYARYQIKKEDICVTGVYLENNEKNIADFAFSPQKFKGGINDIEV